MGFEPVTVRYRCNALTSNQLSYEATDSDKILSGCIGQSIRASHRYREVMGSNPVEVLTFSGFYTQ